MYFVPIPGPATQELILKRDANAELNELLAGIPLTLEEPRGESTKLKLKGFWFRDLNLDQPSDEEARVLTKFVGFIRSSYATYNRLRLSSEELDQVAWEDLSFHQHQGRVFIEDEMGEMFTALRIYSFDYRDQYYRYKRFDNDLQLYLPMERRPHIMAIRESAFQRLFTPPKDYFQEHVDLRLALRKILGLPPKEHADQAGPLRIPPRKMSAKQIDSGIEIHENLQIAELTRYLRNREKPSLGPRSFRHLLRGIAILMD